MICCARYARDLLKVRARSSRALVLRAVRAVCGCQFAVWLFVCRCFVLNGVRVFLCLMSVPSASLAFSLCCVLCVRAPPWLAVRGSRRGCASPRAASLCGGSRAPRRVSRARARSRAPRFAGSASLRARARPPRASVLFVCLSLVCVFVRRPAGCASVRGVSFVFVPPASLALCLCAL